ncbi:MAG TPA: hypothetical protein VGF14_08040 [Alphaproteobacteria bacterium]
MTAQAKTLENSPFSDILPLLEHLPDAPQTMPLQSLASLFQKQRVTTTQLPFLEFLQRWQKIIAVNHPRLCLYASAYDAPDNAAAQTEKNIAACNNPATALQQQCQQINIDLRVYELDLTTRGMTDARAAQAMTYGMLAVEDNIDVLAIHTLSSGADEAAQQLLKTDLPVEHGEMILSTATALMGLDFCAALGACLAARLAQKPVLLSGDFGRALQKVLNRLSPKATEHIYLANEELVPALYQSLYQLQQARFAMTFLPSAV